MPNRSVDNSRAATALVGDGGVLNQLRTVTVFPYTLSAMDDGETLRLDSADAAVVNVPVGLPTNFGCGFVQIGAGAVTIPAVGTTVDSEDDLVDTGGADTACALVSKGTDSYSLFGKLA